MNIVYEFVRAKWFWKFNLYKRQALPTGVTVETLRDRTPKFSISNHQFPREPFYGESLNPLILPRHYGDDGEVQTRKMSALQGLVRMGAFCNDWRILSAVGNPTNGGTFWFDWFVGRMEGDTPIAICEHITLLNLLAMSQGKDDSVYRAWLRPLVSYVREYKTAQLNNHLTWKALFLLTSGAVLRIPAICEEAYYLYTVALKQIDVDGGMPLELARGSKAASYTRMNLEALRVVQYLLNIPANEVILAAHDFFSCCTEHELWKHNHGVTKAQELPIGNLLMAWGWACSPVHPSKEGAPCQNAYVFNFPEAWQ